MSRSNPESKNPAVRFLSWSGSKGELVYYDKDKEERVAVKLPFTFLVLDQLHTITGFHEQDNSSYWANEVRDVQKDELTVKTSGGTKQAGRYKDLTDVRSKGAKYAKSIYIGFEQDGKLVIGNFKASGSALTAWIEFCRKVDVYKYAVKLTGKAEAEKGSTKYFTPVFEGIKISDEKNAEAVELDKQLQAYLSQYLVTRPVEDNHAPVAEDEGADDDSGPINVDDIPF